MIKKIVRALGLLGLIIANVYAYEFRSPVPVEKGSLFYYMGEKNDTWSMQSWSAAYNRSFERAFITNGFNTKQLTALIFNNDQFKVSDAFSPGATAQPTANFNASLGVTTLYPRVSYSEQGLHVGMQADMQGPLKKSRFGLRINVPFKSVRMERDDVAEANASGNQVLYVLSSLGQAYQAIVPVDYATAGATPVTNGVATLPMSINCNMYKASALINLPTMQSGVITPAMAQSQSGNNVTIDSYQYSQGATDNFGGAAVQNNIPYVLFLWTDIKNAPSIANRAVKLDNSITAQLAGNSAEANVFISTVNPGNQAVPNNNIAKVIMDTGNTTPANQVHAYDSNLGTAAANLSAAPLQILPTTYSQIQQGVLYTFAPGQFSEYRQLLQDHGDTLWFMTTHKASDQSLVNSVVDNDIQSKLTQYAAQGPTDWLLSNGYQFNTTQRTGIGDVVLDAFYEYTYSPRCRTEIVLGVRIPTEYTLNNDGNVYKPIIGNNGHYGIKIGGQVSFLACDWIALLADVSYEFTLEGTEHRFAAFQGATIKNIGPVVDASVSFGTFLGRFDATFYHPKNKAFHAVLGYEIKYKEQDDVQFKQKTYDFNANGGTWFGGLYSNTTGQYGLNIAQLDNGVARSNTESIAHKLRFETSLTCFKCVNICAGAGYTIAGQNAPQERDMYIGVKTWF